MGVRPTESTKGLLPAWSAGIERERSMLELIIQRQRQTDGQTDRQIDRHTHTHTPHTHKQIARHTDALTNTNCTHMHAPHDISRYRGMSNLEMDKEVGL